MMNAISNSQRSWIDLGLIALLLINGWTVVRFWQDKRRAGQGARRIPEADLLGLALIGGTPGAYLARRVLRHASHVSTEHLRERTQAFLARRNAAPRPFKWTFAGFELQTGEPKRLAKHACAPGPRQRR